MFEIILEDVISAAHYVKNTAGEVENIHGHDWQIKVSLRRSDVDEVGMVWDFTEVKPVLKEILDHFNYSTLNNIPPFTTQNPTAENLARYIFEQMEKNIPLKNVRMHYVACTESPGCTAIYYGAKK